MKRISDSFWLNHRVIHFTHAAINTTFFFKNRELRSTCHLWPWEGVLFTANLPLYKDRFLASLSGPRLSTRARMLSMSTSLKSRSTSADSTRAIGEKKTTNNMFQQTAIWNYSVKAGTSETRKEEKKKVPSILASTNKQILDQWSPR